MEGGRVVGTAQDQNSYDQDSDSDFENQLYLLTHIYF
jgi:hypothetical protein